MGTGIVARLFYADRWLRERVRSGAAERYVRRTGDPSAELRFATHPSLAGEDEAEWREFDRMLMAGEFDDDDSE